MKARWYVLQVYATFEKKIEEAILDAAQRAGLSDRIVEIFVPSEEAVEIKGNKKVNVQRTLHGGYVYIHMYLDDQIHHLIKSLPRVTGFLGAHNVPAPLSEREINVVRKENDIKREVVAEQVVFETGDKVRVTDGPFQDLSGFVDEIDHEKQRLRVMVAIFGRETSVELEYNQVQRVS